MRGLKFDRAKAESQENLARVAAEAGSWEATEEDDRIYEEAVAEGSIVLGPLGPDGKPLGTR